ncbi:type II toxin-antitoxin system Phd/YefM family antitoxin [Streptomonospora litoralis]|uniref:Antitoxin n=1 Tax=Streptomonospora litoralis TaxID=2498135 RepID=A0A4P6Q2F1_9ACTN|nr:type II toxin-antitoxin system Phd/YefM family antitoxin [Streptomonospora litoralis]QBI54808.1 hypothetical protein EKD16_15155 [Streptomonospora litoralis]
MQNIGIRELQRNPQSVIQQVLESRDEFEITADGRPTGVRLVPDRYEKRRRLSGSDLMEISAMSPLEPGDAAAWRADIENAMDDEVTDPWERT